MNKSNNIRGIDWAPSALPVGNTWRASAWTRLPDGSEIQRQLCNHPHERRPEAVRCALELIRASRRLDSMGDAA